MPPCEGDPVSKVSFVFTGYFNPRPLTGATRAGSPPTTGWQDFNPRPLAGATPSSAQLPPERPISIHAPMRGRPGRWSGRLVQVQFQSTPPRGGDIGRVTRQARAADFNPRPLAGATLSAITATIGTLNFNPRPLTGATDREWSLKPKKRFQSTPPHGGDDGDIVFIKQQPISIHAPSRGRQIFPGRNAHSGNFNPRPLTGATRHGPGSHGPCSDFNPRPLTGATYVVLVTGK